jgi:uncharacterized protein YkwD
MHLCKVVTLAISLILGHATANVWSDQVLAAHNTARAKYGASNLTWSVYLYANTSAYASKCAFVHSVRVLHFSCGS